MEPIKIEEQKKKLVKRVTPLRSRNSSPVDFGNRIIMSSSTEGEPSPIRTQLIEKSQKNYEIINI